MTNVTKKNKKKKNSLAGLVVKLILAGLMISLVVSIISGQMQVAAKQRELAEITEKLELQSETNAELERLMESGDEDAYVERVAREKLGYARPDERVFVDISGQ